MKVQEKVCPWLRIPESNFWAPVGMEVDTTVCCIESRSTQVTVLLMPMTTVIEAGWKFRDSLPATP